MSKISLFLIFSISISLFADAQVPVVSQLSNTTYISFATQQADNLKDSLGLNSAQTNSVKTIYTDYFLAIINLNNNSLSINQRKSQIKILNDNRETQLKEVLTEQQYEKYQMLLERIRQKSFKIHH